MRCHILNVAGSRRGVVWLEQVMLEYAAKTAERQSPWRVCPVFVDSFLVTDVPFGEKSRCLGSSGAGRHRHVPSRRCTGRGYSIVGHRKKAIASRILRQRVVKQSGSGAR